jgi:hypothetical protein
MKRNGRTILAVSTAIAVLLAVAGWHLHRTNLAGTQQFDAAFYAKAQQGAGEAFSYDGYARVLKANVNEKGMVDYRRLKEKSGDLDAFLLAMGRVAPETYGSWDEKTKTAFWINAYNALTLKAIIDHYPIKSGLLSGLAYPADSIRQIPGVWDKLQFLVMGRKLTMDQIEHGILRGRDKDLVVSYGKFHEPRIHVALVCAAMGCPPLRNEPYTGRKLDAQLDDQAKRFVSDPAKFLIDRDGGKVYLSGIFKWFGGDFVAKHEPAEGFASGKDRAQKAVLNVVADYLSAEDAEYLKTGKYRVEYLDYDWSLNEQ